MADPTWRPLGRRPTSPSTRRRTPATAARWSTALDAFFGTDKVRFTLDSRVTGTDARTYERFQDVVKDVDRARVLAGFHFRNSDQEGSNLGRHVGSYVADHYFQPLG